MSQGAANKWLSMPNTRRIIQSCVSTVKNSSTEPCQKSPNILECLAITERGIHFLYHTFGSLRDYIQNNEATMHTREQWINNAIDAVALIHSYGVIHADISPRNFLVADGQSLKLCDFPGSAIGDLEPLVMQEDRYRVSWSPRTFKTDLFALGCLIYELSTGTLPYGEIDDDQEIERLYNEEIFPSLEALRYRDVIHKCWTSQYENMEMLRVDYSHCAIRDMDDPAWSGVISRRVCRRPSMWIALGFVNACYTFFGAYHEAKSAVDPGMVCSGERCT